MSLIIQEECIACDACKEECPNEAINEGDPIYIIDPERCTECLGHFDEPACVAVCPIDCIISDPNHQETPEELMAKRARLEKAS